MKYNRFLEWPYTASQSKGASVGWIGFLLSAISFPFKIVWNIVHVSYLKVQLESERRKLRRLRQLADGQLSGLQSGTSPLLSFYIDDLSCRVSGRSESEPYVLVQLRFFNGSVFTIKLANPTIQVKLGGDPLTLASTLKPQRLVVPPGNALVLTFTQPVQSATAQRIIEKAEACDQVSWEIELRSDYSAEEAEIEAELTPGSLHILEYPKLS